MNKFIFKKVKDPDNDFDNYDLIMESEALTRTDVLMDFLSFLDGCGYSTKKIREQLELE